MRWINNLQTATKLSLGFGLVVVLLAVVVATAYRAIGEVERSSAFAQALTATESNLNEHRADLLTMMAVTDRTSKEALQKNIADRTDETDEYIRTITRLGGADSRLPGKIEELSSIRVAFNHTRDTQLIPLILDGKLDEARVLALGVQRDRYIRMRDLGSDLAEDAVQQSTQQARRARVTFSSVGLLSVFAAALIVSVLTRIIANPLREISRVAERMASGDLTVALANEPRADEVGRLTQTFARMAGNLREQTQELAEGASVLSAAASEIVASTAQLASSASEAAAAVSETTTTVEEVRQTAQLASQKAKYVSDSAQKAAQISQSGRKSTEDVGAAMTRIRQQVDAIAASMGRLSEQSQTIGQIIATVEDLAAQSNLLAVNAAIEAAKAGEHGKGFGVVAQEVKSLAEQSRQATTQVRTILSDIQKATATAVLATEQGSKAVEAGARQTAIADESIQALAGSVTEAAQAATQIAASSQQQLVGVDQVAAAMDSIQQSSTQNVASATQLETAARNLNELGQRIKQMVARYKV